MSDVQTDDHPTAPAPRYTRRLSDKILIAFHYACDQGDFDAPGPGDDADPPVVGPN
jgi:hypothetical protein